MADAALRTCPFIVNQLHDYREYLQRLPLARPANEVRGIKECDTPPCSRGTTTLVDDEQLKIERQLGPLMWNHVFRGASRATRISTWA